MDGVRAAWNAVYAEALRRHPRLLNRARRALSVRNTARVATYVCATVTFVVTCSWLCTWYVRSWLLPEQVALDVPLNFVFRTCERGGVCSFPVANVSLVRSDGSSFFERAVRYDAVLALTVADDDVVRRGRMFIVACRLLDGDGRAQRVIRRSTSFPYRSSVVQRLSAALRAPLVLLGVAREVQSRRIALFTRYPIVDDEPPYLSVTVEHMDMTIVTARLLVHADLSLRDWLVVHWPLASSLVIFTLNVVLFSLVASLFWLHQIVVFAVHQLLSPSSDGEWRDNVDAHERQHDDPDHEERDDEHRAHLLD